MTKINKLIFFSLHLLIYGFSVVVVGSERYGCVGWPLAIVVCFRSDTVRLPVVGRVLSQHHRHAVQGHGNMLSLLCSVPFMLLVARLHFVSVVLICSSLRHLCIARDTLRFDVV